MTAAALVDLDRYPLLDPSGRATLVAAKRADIARDGAAMLPGFVRAEALATMVAEYEAAMADAYRRDFLVGAYDGPAPGVLAPDHPTLRTHPFKMWAIAMDLLPRDGAIRALYEWEPLTRLVAEIMERPVLHRVADPLLGCVVTVMAEGDQHGWHFDSNEFVTSLLLAKPEAGGAFEYAPFVRSEAAENYAGVAAVMDEASVETRSVNQEPGTLAIFCGSRSLHRVAPVAGARRRAIALLSFDSAPAMTYSVETQRSVTGRTAEAAVTR